MTFLLHQYVSTACQHGHHNRCRVVCKFCSQACLCHCHWKAEALPRAAAKYEEEMKERWRTSPPEPSEER